MKRRIKPIFLNMFIVILFLFLIFITYGNIVGISNDKVNSNNNIEINLLNSENLTLTQLMMQTSNICNRGPRPKPEKIAYITIDDGPSKYTNDILKILNKNNVKATFFMVEGNMKKYQESLKIMANQKHALGFHSVSHDINILYKTPESAVNEFDKCKKTLEEITNQKSNLIRLPYGSKPYASKEDYDALVNAGYKIWDWNLDTEDWRATPKDIVDNVAKYSGQHKEIVLLMHEKEQSVKALQGIIDVLKSKGYTILPIDERDTPKNYWEQNLTN
ncbi:MAG: polysaccharide deacetylase family protein [Peptostreptococcaceae bacterium]